MIKAPKDKKTQEEKDAMTMEQLLAYCLRLSVAEGPQIIIKRLIKEIESLKRQVNENTHA